MQALNNLIVTVRPFMPVAYVGLLLLTVGILWYLFTVLRAARKRMAVLDAGGKDAGQGDKPGQGTSPPPPGGAAPALPRPGDLRQSFANSVRMLRAHVSGKNYRYEIPWFMMAGPAGSGKTTALRNTGLYLPMGEPYEEVTAGHSGCNWWFFDKGVVLDVVGDYLLRQDGVTSDQRGWDGLLKLLRRYRPERPIDGVILTIPSTDLMLPDGQGDQGLERAREKADLLYKKLWDAQKALGICFPVYVLVTKCDQITGFRSFCNELPAQLHQGIFGWSSPYVLEAGFTSGWVDEAIQGVLGNLSQSQGELFAQVREVRDSDGLFLFPSEFQSTLDTLRVFLNQVFRPSVYHESFFFRGIYFCGDGDGDADSPAVPSGASPASLPGEEALPVDPLPDSTVGLRAPSSALPPSPRPQFLKHLFEKKIFPEWGLARPSSSTVLSRNLSTKVAQVALVVLLLVGGLGLWRGYEKLRRQIQTLLPVLRTVVVDLKRSRELFDTGMEAERIAQQRKASLHLLEGMSSANANSLRSAFFPSSWFSPTHRDLGIAMTAAYDEIILKSIFNALNQKARDLLSRERKGVPPDSTRPADLLPVSFEEMPQFKALRQFVEETTALEREAGRYNGLKNSKELSDLSNLVLYLYGIELPPEFAENAEYYHSALKDTQYRFFEVSSLKGPAGTAARNLASRFFEGLIQQNALRANLEGLAEDLKEIDQRRGRAGGGGGEAGFRDLMEDITRAETALSSPQLAWIFADGFDPGPAFEQALAAMDNSAILGPDLRAEIQAMGESRAQRFRAALAAVETPMTGPVFQSDGGKLQASLSPRVTSLKGVIADFLRQDLGGREPSRTFRAEIPAGARLMWDASLLEQAAMLSQPSGASSDQLRLFPVTWQNTLKRMASERMKVEMVDLIAQAQTFEPAPLGGGREEDLRAEVRNFKEASGPMGGLLAAFDRLGYNDPFEDLSDLAVAQASDMLTQVDKLLEQEELYEVGDFSSWDGKGPISLAVFEARDASDLNYYLDVQRERVKFLVDEYAEPLAAFLGNSKVSRGQVYIPILAKWQRIIGELRKFDQKKPGNSVAALESFILSDMDQIRLDNFFQKIPGGDLKEQSGDFFLQRRNRLRREIYDRCEGVSEHLLATGYGEVERFFNQTLAGRFPFTKGNLPDASGEADPGDVQEFFRLYDRNVKVDREFLRRSKRLGASLDQVLDFLYQMDRVRAFLGGGKAGDGDPGQAGPPVVDLDVDFRVNQRQEVGGNEIIDWSLQLGDQRIGGRDADRRGRWTFGDPVRVSLRWAKDAPNAPAGSQGAQADRASHFEYVHRWSLLSLLRVHASAPSDFSALVDPKPYTLKFLIPVQTAGRGEKEEEAGSAGTPSRVYIRITPVSPDGKDRLVLPTFPEKAPSLGQEKVSRKE